MEMAEGLQFAPERSLWKELSLQKWWSVFFFPSLGSQGHYEYIATDKVLYVARDCEKS